MDTSFTINLQKLIVLNLTRPIIMQDLIKITQTNINGAESVNSVNAKEVYEHLEVKTAFTTWFNRCVEKYDFIENENFISILKESNGGRPEKVFIVTLDMAKELCMIADTPKGKETRKYFIRAEKQANRPLTITEQIALIAQGHQEVNERLTKLEETKRLENWQEKALIDAKNKKVYELAGDDKKMATKLHRKVWSLFKKEFHLPRYNELPSLKFEDGLRFIQNLTLSDMI